MNAMKTVLPEKGLTDPHAIQVDGRLYVFCGHDQSWNSENDWIMDRWEVWSTVDLQQWRPEAVIRPEDTYIGPHRRCWAGDITCRNGEYFWYFSNGPRDTGVMRAPGPAGPWRDALGRPLLPDGIVDVHPYDPDVFEEDGEHTIVFGCGKYYAARLAEDMISLAGKPRLVEIHGIDRVDDKPCVFKHGGTYYLSWGGGYAVSDRLLGPYEYQGPFPYNGAFPAGGHANVFEWHGRLYIAQENKDIGLFYRGFMIHPLTFSPQGAPLIHYGETDLSGRVWDFTLSAMGWRAKSGTTLQWLPEGRIRGVLSGHAVIESCPWPIADLDRNKRLLIRLRNRTAADRAAVHFAVRPDEPCFWMKPGVEWRDEDCVTFAIRPHDDGFTDYEIDMTSVPGWHLDLKRLRIEPALDVTEGAWEIERMRICP
jgi:hypothetical protein